MPFRVGQTGDRGYESGIIATNKTKTYKEKDIGKDRGGHWHTY